MPIKTIKTMPFGIVMNPKLGTLTYCGMRPAYAGPGAPNLISLLLMNGQEIAVGYFDTGEYPSSTMASGYPRVHTSPGVTNPKMRSLGFGSPLYYSLALASEMQRLKRFDSPIMLGRKGAGISSTPNDGREPPAEEWWNNAVDKFGIAERGEGCATKEVDYMEAKTESAAEEKAIKYAASDLGLEKYGSADARMTRVERDSYDGIVKFCGIPYETLKYSAIEKYVACQIIPEKKIDNKKRFDTLDEVPKPWFKANKAVLLCANVGELEQMLGPTATAVMVRLIEALERAGATTAEVDEFTARFERGIDSWCKPEKGSGRVRTPSGAIRPTNATYDIVYYRGSGQLTALDRELAHSVAVRRQNLGWDAYW